MLTKEDTLVTKEDILSLRKDISRFRIKVNKRFDTMILWIVGTGVGIVAITFTIIKLFIIK